MRLLPALLSASVLFAVPALAQDTKPAKPAKEKKICQIETRTGSRLDRGRVCRTAAEWDAIRRDTADKAREMQDRVQSPVAN